MSRPAPPRGVRVTEAPHNPEAWVLTVAGRAVCWRFYPEIVDGKKPHGRFVTLEGWPHGPVTAQDMRLLAAAATAVAERMEADEKPAVDPNQVVLFDREVA